MKAEAVIALLQEAADECLRSSQQNGEYNAAFYVAHIVLLDISKRVGASSAKQANGESSRDETND